MDAIFGAMRSLLNRDSVDRLRKFLAYIPYLKNDILLVLPFSVLLITMGARWL